MKIISDDCKKLINLMKEYDKWQIQILSNGKYYVYRYVKCVEIQLLDDCVYIDSIERKWGDRFNFIESIYLDYEKCKLRAFKIGEHKKSNFDKLI